MKEKIMRNPFLLAIIIVVSYLLLLIFCSLMNLSFNYLGIVLLIAISMWVGAWYSEVFKENIPNKLRNITSLIAFFLLLGLTSITSTGNMIFDLNVWIILTLGLLILWAALPGAIVHTFLLKWSKMGLRIKEQQNKNKEQTREQELQEKTVV